MLQERDGKGMSETTRVSPTFDAVRRYRDDVFPLAARYGVSNIRVLGSVARAEATPDSDIDLLVIAPEGISILNLVGLWLDLQDLRGRDVSLVTDDAEPQRERFL